VRVRLSDHASVLVVFEDMVVLFGSILVLLIRILSEPWLIDVVGDCVEGALDVAADLLLSSLLGMLKLLALAACSRP